MQGTPLVFGDEQVRVGVFGDAADVVLVEMADDSTGDIAVL